MIRMDIQQLYYFINIVECDYNLSLAAKKIHISQPALSQFISNFENEKDVQLFNRKQGRLNSLTRAGEMIYQYALQIVKQHEEMQEMVRVEGLKQKGTIRIGLPSLILRVYFSDYFPNLVLNNPNVHLEIIENGSNDLRKKLINGEIDIAILIEPTSLDTKNYEQHVIQIDEMVAFMDPNNPLAEKEKLEWPDLKDYPIATFNSTFMTNHLVTQKLETHSTAHQIQFTSSSWDYLIETTRNKDIVAILPRPIEKFFQSEQTEFKHFRDYIPFNFHLCRSFKKKYTSVENFVFDDLINHFYQPVE